MANQPNETDKRQKELILSRGTKTNGKIYSTKNTYSISDGIIYIQIEDKIMKVNERHKDIVLNSSWNLSRGYAVATVNYKKIRCHRLITNASSEKVVDHKDHDKLNNLDENLIVCTQKQNMRNRAKQTGVNYHKKIKKWIARINVDGKDIHLGCFEDYNSALKARKDAESRVWSSV